MDHFSSSHHPCMYINSQLSWIDLWINHLFLLLLADLHIRILIFFSSSSRVQVAKAGAEIYQQFVHMLNSLYEHRIIYFV